MFLFTEEKNITEKNNVLMMATDWSKTSAGLPCMKYTNLDIVYKLIILINS